MCAIFFPFTSFAVLKSRCRERKFTQICRHTEKFVKMHFVYIRFEKMSFEIYYRIKWKEEKMSEEVWLLPYNLLFEQNTRALIRIRKKTLSKICTKTPPLPIYIDWSLWTYCFVRFKVIFFCVLSCWFVDSKAWYRFQQYNFQYSL